MNPSIHLRRVGRSAALLGLLLAAAATESRAAEITAFATGAEPGATWKTGYGGMLTITLFNFVGGELEGAYQGSDFADTSIASGAAKAYLGPSIGRFVPYAGLGAGAYRESLPGRSDQGTYGLVFAGAKLKFPFGLVVRGEYQWITMPSDVLVPLDNRYLFAAGLSF
jgi:hypothetical protein